MKTGLSKKQKATNIYFNEADSMIEVCTYNTALKNRLTEYAGKYPSECRLIDGRQRLHTDGDNAEQPQNSRLAFRGRQKLHGG